MHTVLACHSDRDVNQLLLNKYSADRYFCTFLPTTCLLSFCVVSSAYSDDQAPLITLTVD